MDSAKVLSDNLTAQLKRLIEQLKDLEELSEEAGMSQEEIQSIKVSTMEQIKDFNRSILNAKAGKLSLIDALQEQHLVIASYSL